MYAEPVNVIEEKTLKGTVNVISKCEVSMPRSFFFFRISRRQEFPSLSQTSFFCFSPRGSLWSLFFVPIFHFLISNLPRPHVKLNKMIHIEEEPIKFIENEQNMTLIFETDHGHYLCFQDREKVTTRWNLNGLKST